MMQGTNFDRAVKRKEKLEAIVDGLVKCSRKGYSNFILSRIILDLEKEIMMGNLYKYGKDSYHLSSSIDVKITDWRPSIDIEYIENKLRKRYSKKGWKCIKIRESGLVRYVDKRFHNYMKHIMTDLDTNG